MIDLKNEISLCLLCQNNCLARLLRPGIPIKVGIFILSKKKNIINKKTKKNLNTIVTLHHPSKSL